MNKGYEFINDPTIVSVKATYEYSYSINGILNQTQEELEYYKL